MIHLLNQPPTGTPRFTEQQLLASICKDSFFHFVKEFWHTVIPEKPVWNWHIEYLCNRMQRSAERVFRGEPRKADLVVNIPPGSSKSTIASIMFPIWVWTRMPSSRSICASYAYPLAMDLSRKSRDVFRSELFRACYPHILVKEDQDSKGYFQNTAGGYRYAVGVNGSVMGMHAHFIIVDDPLDPNRAVSEAELKSTNYWMNETLPSRKVDKAVSVLFLIMQRLHQEDPSGVALNNPKRRVAHVCLPAEDSPDVRPLRLRKVYGENGGLLDPVRLPSTVLDEAHLMGEYAFSCQYRQSPIPAGGGMFKTTAIQIHRLPPERFKGFVRYWDKAGTRGGGAFTVGTLMGKDTDGRFWVLDVVRGQWDAATRENIILNTALTDTRAVVVGIEQEPGSGGKESAEATVRRLAGFLVQVDKPGASEGNKERRADPFAVQVNSGNVCLKQAPWNKEWLEEFSYFPYSKYKDQVDSGSGAFNMLARPRKVVGGMW